jgi:hypothetical protein
MKKTFVYKFSLEEAKDILKSVEQPRIYASHSNEALREFADALEEWVNEQNDIS